MIQFVIDNNQPTKYGISSPPATAFMSKLRCCSNHLSTSFSTNCQTGNYQGSWCWRNTDRPTMWHQWRYSIGWQSFVEAGPQPLVACTTCTLPDLLFVSAGKLHASVIQPSSGRLMVWGWMAKTWCLIKLANGSPGKVQATEVGLGGWIHLLRGIWLT